MACARAALQDAHVLPGAEAAALQRLRQGVHEARDHPVEPVVVDPVRPAPVRALHLLEHLRQRVLDDLPARARSSRTCCGASARSSVSSSPACARCRSSRRQRRSTAACTSACIVIVAWVGFQRLRAGAWRTVLGIVAALVVGVVAWLATPASQSLLDRVAASSSTEDRASNYLETLNELPQSPLLGFGAPRPSASSVAALSGHPGPVLDGHLLLRPRRPVPVPRLLPAHVPAHLAGQGRVRLDPGRHHPGHPGRAVLLRHEHGPHDLRRRRRAAVASPGGGERPDARAAGRARYAASPVPSPERSAPSAPCAWGEWRSPAANDGAFSTRDACSTQQVGSSGNEKPDSFQF